LERGRNPAGLHDPKACAVEQSPERSEREEACVREVQDPARAVVELAGEQHEPGQRERHVTGKPINSLLELKALCRSSSVPRTHS
jgi:hypothetical protein